MNDIGEILETARRAAGLTQEELARRAQITQAALSRYENGWREPEPDVLQNLAAALAVTESFLLDSGRAHGAMAVDAHMRRRQTARPTVWRRLEAQLNMHRFHARHLFEEVSVHADQTIPQFDPIAVQPAAAARMVRMQWKIPVGPVRSLMRWLEAAGCLVIEDDLATTRVDGLSQWIGEHPIILINSAVPNDRKRLTLAHELGHLCLHSQEVTDSIEHEATEFAAEFLTPAEVIKPQLRNLTMGRLHDLKRQGGVSMQMIVERAYSLGVITTGQRTNLYKMFSRKGWRIQEPVSEEIPPEEPVLTYHIGSVLLSKGLTEDEIARLAGYRNADRPHPFQPPTRRLRAVKD